MSYQSLSKTIDTSAPDIYFDPKFRIMIEQHLAALATTSGVTYISITARERLIFDGNFYALLYSHSVPVYLHWIIMRVNGYDSTTDFRASDEMDQILIPEVEMINKLRDVFTTIQTIA